MQFLQIRRQYKKKFNFKFKIQFSIASFRIFKKKYNVVTQAAFKKLNFVFGFLYELKKRMFIKLKLKSYISNNILN